MALRRQHNYYVYILTNKNNTILYTGVTNDLFRRVQEHKFGTGSSFTKKYNINKLVYTEYFTDIKAAIQREKQIKAGSRKKKIWLIESVNKNWEDIQVERKRIGIASSRLKPGFAMTEHYKIKKNPHPERSGQGVLISTPSARGDEIT